MDTIVVSPKTLRTQADAVARAVAQAKALANTRTGQTLVETLELLQTISRDLDAGEAVLITPSGTPWEAP